MFEFLDFLAFLEVEGPVVDVLLGVHQMHLQHDININSTIIDMLHCPLLQFLMIKIENSYYSCSDSPAQPPQDNAVPQKKDKECSLEAVGDVKGLLSNVSQQIQQIKALRLKQKEESMKNQTVLEKLNPKSEQPADKDSNIRLHITVPTELYELDERIAALEDKVKINEMVRQKIQRKGKISERAKMLSIQIQKLSQKSPDIIESVIQKYCQGLQEKEENMKSLFLYEAFIATQGMNEQIETLSIYLNNLNTIQTKLKGMASKQSIVDNHTKILEKRVALSEHMARLHAHMKQQYEKLMKEIDSL